MNEESGFSPELIEVDTDRLELTGGTLAFVEQEPADSAEAPLVLVHGWCSNRHSLAPQFNYWSQTRRTVALDLRGHGESGAMAGPYSVEQFADDLANVCQTLNVQRPVLVGHSMGGAVSLEAVRRNPDLASRVVLLDGYGCYPDEQRNALGQMLLQQIASLGFAPVMEMVVDQAFFLPGADPALISWIKAELTKTDPQMAVEAYGNLLEWDGAGAAAACTLPVLNLVSTVPFNEPERFSQVCPHAINDQTDGAGHFHGIEVPEQVHSIVDRFLTGAS